MIKIYLYTVASLLLVFTTQAQQDVSGSFGSTYVPSSGFISIFGNHTFDFADCAFFPGLILTERSGDPGYVNFTSSATWTDASNESYIDGYARTFSTGPFVFPIGNDGKLRLLGISGSEEAAATFLFEDPSIVTGSMTIVNADIDAVTTREYWKLSGDNATIVTLTWDQLSNVEDLVNGDINKLSIVGWTDMGWVEIPSVINEFTLQSNSQNIFDEEITTSFSIGSLSSADPVNIDDFILITLGSLAVPRSSLVEDGAMSLFPNPAKEGTPTYVSYNLRGNRGKIEIYDGSNRMIYSELLTSPKGSVLIPNLNLTDDRYVVTMIDEDGTKTSKFLIMIR